jgi:hypothetical protein
MAAEGLAQQGHGDVSRCEVTRTSTSSGVSLIDVISSPCGKGKSGVVGIPCYLLQKFLQEHNRQIGFFQCLTKSWEEPVLS